LAITPTSGTGPKTFLSSSKSALIVVKERLDTMNKSMTDFITTVKNSRPSTHWKELSKSKEVAILKGVVLVVQEDINKGSVSTFAMKFCARMKKRPELYELSHLI
jgi:hypothetical protein